MSTSSQRPFLSLPKTYYILTKVQNISAIAFSTFTVVHVSQLLAANVGGVQLSNRMLMLGRPFYQDQHIEGLVITGAAVTHAMAGMGKWLIRYYWRTPNNNNSTYSLHSLSGYLLIPLMGLHYILVRNLPKHYYGDSSFIDFGYVAWGLQNRPLFTSILHVGLIMTSTYHIMNGFKYLINGNKKKSTHKQRYQVIFERGLVACTSLALISSLFIIGKETKKIPLRLDFEKIYKQIYI
ncbi:uncharacterized protein BX663DRAFT_509119 [Cokeromyces recurvatus]|uniref:uncharacterized protein n=1 Tax=Cokeromyces recurvatus TaxID=90255 RepID=UPI0022200873|nr:uncharacterized protein BX663DRAFT_509119 [Cokeromyces recurvatus]KAI7902989.1 hypothetical protein BX663DRAFT_509119 [Cokeromyces recurvatus]